MASLTGQNNPAGQVLDISECAFLSSWCDDGQRFASQILAFELCDHRSVLAVTSLARAESVVEVADGIGHVVPASVVIDEVDVGRLGKGVWILVAAIALDGELRAGSRIN